MEYTNPIKSGWKMRTLRIAIRCYIVFLIAYGAYTSSVNLYHFTNRKYDQFIATQAIARNLVSEKVLTREVPVVKAADALPEIKKAAQEGAENGTHAAVKQELGKQ